MTKDPSSRRATVILFGLCVIAASAIAGAAAYRYMFWGDQLPGGFAISPVDLDGEGSPEYLIVKAAVNLPESGDYTAVAILADPATGIAVSTTTGRVEMDRGADIFGTGFWAPDIRKAQTSGPYEVRLTFIREQSDSIFERSASPDMVGRVYQWTYSTPAYDWRTFQEQPAGLVIAGPATAVKQVRDGNGLADALAIDVPVSVRKPGEYFLSVQSNQISLEGVTDRFFPGAQSADLSRPQFVQMTSGSQQLEVTVPADRLYLSGIDGPMDVHITISSASGQVITHPCCGTTTPSFSQDPAFSPPPDGSVFGLRPPYLLPPTPNGVRAETHLIEVVHWYDYTAPWMPISFVGNVRDFGTDANGNGVFDYLSVEANVNVHSLGSYDLSGILYAAGSEPSNQVLMRSTPDASKVVTTAWTRVSFNDWSQLNSPQTVRLDFAGAEILSSGLKGPYDVKLRIVPAAVVIDPVTAHTTAAYDLSQFEATGAKAARLPSVGIFPTGGGGFDVHLDVSAISSQYSVMIRIIHANGAVATDSTFRAGSSLGLSFHTDTARAMDFAVAVYLVGPGGSGVDYIEVPLSR